MRNGAKSLIQNKSHQRQAWRLIKANADEGKEEVVRGGGKGEKILAGRRTIRRKFNLENVTHSPPRELSSAVGTWKATAIKRKTWK